jgi:transcriptional regulator with XRE-family HTH domain
VDNRIRVLREARGLSLEELAAEVGTTNQQISLLENGKRRLTVEWLVRLSKALTCHPWELVAGNLPQPMRPTDIRLLERFRGLAEPQQDALLQFLETLSVSRPRRRRAVPSE